MNNKLIMFLVPATIISNIGISAYATTNESTNNNKINIKELEKNEDYSILSLDGSDIKKVKLPDGNFVNKDSFKYMVNKNGSYDFTYKTADNETKTYAYNVTGLRASYLITPTESVKLKLSSTDTLSGLSSMKFKNEESGKWSSYEPYKTSKDWTLDSVEGLKTVYVTYKDIAGNESTEVFDKIILDKTGPEITQFVINNNDIYTKTRDVILNITAIDNFSEVSKLLISNDDKTWVEVPYSTKVPWTLDSGAGNKTVSVKAVDSLGNIGEGRYDSIYLDDILPKGSISINNGSSLTNSKNVKLQFSFKDSESGVKRVSIIEKDKIYNLPNVSSSSGEIPWTLSHGDTGQVIMEVEDNAGNILRTSSNKIVISTLEITQFRLTNVVNPTVFNATNPFKALSWTFPPQEMKAGANISFDINYKLELDDKSKSVVNGDYYIEIIGDGYHKIIQSKYNEPIINGFKSTITLPTDIPKGSKLYLSSKVTSILESESETFTNKASFPSNNEKALIGIINGNIKEDIIFNEIS